MVRLASFPEWKPRVQCVAETHPVDWVVLSCGYVPVNGLVDELADLGDKVVVVGDAILSNKKSIP